jgi:DnaJ-class molecular chaperone
MNIFEPSECSECGGSGRIIDSPRFFRSAGAAEAFDDMNVCGACNGSGEIRPRCTGCGTSDGPLTETDGEFSCAACDAWLEQLEARVDALLAAERVAK